MTYAKFHAFIYDISKVIAYLMEKCPPGARKMEISEVSTYV